MTIQQEEGASVGQGKRSACRTHLLASGRRRLKQAAARLWTLTGGERRMLRGIGVILAYHRVLPKDKRGELTSFPGLTVWRDVFERQLDALASHFRIVPLDQLARMFRDGTWEEGGRYCALTFDDGWKDNYLHAFPALKARGLPATIFLATAFVGTGRMFWWDAFARIVELAGKDMLPNRRQVVNRLTEFGLQPDHVLTTMDGGVSMAVRRLALDLALEDVKQASPDEIEELFLELREMARLDVSEPAALDWRDILEMSDHSISFGSHTANHRILTRLPDHILADELQTSRRAILANGARYANVFCYPNGDCDARTAEAVSRAGYEAAVSCVPGHVALETSSGADMLRLPRLTVQAVTGDSPSDFLFMVNGGFSGRLYRSHEKRNR